MRLVTHNMLKSNVRGVSGGYPLVIEAEHIETRNSDVNPELVRKLLSGKIDWNALKAAAENLRLTELAGYDQFSEQLLEDEEFVRNVHRVLFDVHVITGHLVCPETGRKFPIKDGIPNMLLNEDEV